MTLRERRKEANLSLDHLAFLSGIDRAKLSRLERGYAHPRRDERFKIATALGVQPEEITWLAVPVPRACRVAASALSNAPANEQGPVR